jgi:uncharacterized RmlC-like cupin family protein
MTAIDGSSVGARSLWVGRVRIQPSTSSGAHHHGDCESAIFVISGSATFRYGDDLQHTVEAGPGDYLYIPPNVIHQELNLSTSEAIDCIVIRDSQENLVINVDLPGPEIAEHRTLPVGAPTLPRIARDALVANAKPHKPNWPRGPVFVSKSGGR